MNEKLESMIKMYEDLYDEIIKDYKTMYNTSHSHDSRTLLSLINSRSNDIQLILDALYFAAGKESDLVSNLPHYRAAHKEDMNDLLKEVEKGRR